MGFSGCVLPKRNMVGLSKALKDKIELYPVESVEEVIEGLLGEICVPSK
jgi:predicted ATP-dependent protease